MNKQKIKKEFHEKTNRNAENAAIGLRVKMARIECGMGQEEFSKKLGIHRVSLSKIEKGRAGVSRETISKISGLTSKPISYFFGEQQAPNPYYEINELRKMVNMLREELAEYKKERG